MAPDDRSLEQRSDGHRHEWTTFEFDIMLSLICKGTHLHGIVEFATKFNEGLNGAGYSGHRRDVDMEDIQEILLYILDKKKAAVAFIERQHSEYLSGIIPLPLVGKVQKFMPKVPNTCGGVAFETSGNKPKLPSTKAIANSRYCSAASYSCPEESFHAQHQFHRHSEGVEGRWTEGRGGAGAPKQGQTDGRAAAEGAVPPRLREAC